jgi:hypothetical protein
MLFTKRLAILIGGPAIIGVFYLSISDHLPGLDLTTPSSYPGALNTSSAVIELAALPAKATGEGAVTIPSKPINNRIAPYKTNVLDFDADADPGNPLFAPHYEAPVNVGAHMAPDDPVLASDYETPINIGAYINLDNLEFALDHKAPVNLGAYIDADNPEFVSDYEAPVMIGAPIDADTVLVDLGQNELL